MKKKEFHSGHGTFVVKNTENVWSYMHVFVAMLAKITLKIIFHSTFLLTNVKRITVLEMFNIRESVSK